jgi:predicted DNA-binding transcriptional regulator AlpA
MRDNERLLRLPEVKERVGLARSAIFEARESWDIPATHQTEQQTRRLGGIRHFRMDC